MGDFDRHPLGGVHGGGVPSATLGDTQSAARAILRLVCEALRDWGAVVAGVQDGRGHRP